MELKLRQLTPAEQAMVDDTWQEIGAAIAAAIVDCGKTQRWAWDLIGHLGLYKRWMISHWVIRYQQESAADKQRSLTQGKR